MTKLRMMLAAGAIVLLAGCSPLASSVGTAPPAEDEDVSTASRAYTDQKTAPGWDLRDAQRW